MATMNLAVSVALLTSGVRTQTKLAILTGIGRSTLHRALAGTGRPLAPAEQQRVAEALERPVEDLFGHAPEEP